MKISTLYLTRNGLLEPLGQSQIFGYLKGLSDKYSVVLITFEKPGDWENQKLRTQIKEECEHLGITWKPLKFRSGPKYIAPAFGIIQLFSLTLYEIIFKKCRLIHARSYIPAFVGYILNIFTKTPFIFDMRALWPEELISSGSLVRNSLVHKIIVWIERKCLHKASCIVSLTHAAVDHLKETYPKELKQQNIQVIPTCADLTRFTPPDDRPTDVVIGCLGTVVSGWFKLDWLVLFFGICAQRDKTIRFEITTRDKKPTVLSAFSDTPELVSRLSVAPASSMEVPIVLKRQTASVMFFKSDLGKLGSSPTRMAEILGTGIPVITNKGVGDVAEIVKKYRVGVLVNGPNEQDMLDAFNKLEVLLKDPDLSHRCRTAADEIFSLNSGINTYLNIYESITKRAS